MQTFLGPEKMWGLVAVYHFLNWCYHLTTSRPLVWIYCHRIVKEVSRSQKEILDSPHTPKNQRNFSHFFALASKKWSNKKIKALYAFIEAILHNKMHKVSLLSYLTPLCPRHLMSPRAKKCKKRSLVFQSMGRNQNLLTFSTATARHSNQGHLKKPLF